MNSPNTDKGEPHPRSVLEDRRLQPRRAARPRHHCSQL